MVTLKLRRMFLAATAVSAMGTSLSFVLNITSFTLSRRLRNAATRSSAGALLEYRGPFPSVEILKSTSAYRPNTLVTTPLNGPRTLPGSSTVALTTPCSLRLRSYTAMVSTRTLPRSAIPYWRRPPNGSIAGISQRLGLVQHVLHQCKNIMRSTPQAE